MQFTNEWGERCLFYDKELEFLCSFLEKCHISVSFVKENELLNLGNKEVSIGSIAEKIEDETVYYLAGLFDCKYLFFRLPEHRGENGLLIGPYLTNEVEEKNIIEWSDKHGLDAKKQKSLKEFYASLPILYEYGVAFTVLETFWETIWKKKNFKNVDINQVHSAELIAKIQTSPFSGENSSAQMKVMEKRYKFENDMMDAVSNGQIHKIEAIFTGFSDVFFEKRVADQLRNLKNYAIIMNTLLRKAAEKGGVHPIYINSVSSAYAFKIENASSNMALRNLMAEMFRDYCRLVRKHTMKNFSAPVQKAIVCIDTDLSADLSLNRLASLQNLNPSYLSSLFKKETGTTITEFVNNRRIKYAINLLETTKIQIQTVAQYSGIEDVNYFIRLFKRFTGVTPKQYRQNLFNNQT